MAYVYGKVRALAQPLISTDFNINHIEGGVYICDIASAYNEDELKELGITHIVTAVLAVGPKFPDSFEYMCVPVRDIESEDIYSHLDKTTKFINDAVESGGKVAVHCICGVSRSATIVAAWVMSRHGYSVKETIEVLQSRRECVDPNPSFRKQLETFHADLSK